MELRKEGGGGGWGGQDDGKTERKILGSFFGPFYLADVINCKK